MLHIGTTSSSGAEQVTPGGIAQRQGGPLAGRLNREIAQGGEPVYIRLMAEMDGHWNAYSAYGPRRDAAHSTKAFKAAWRRTTLILRGGPGVDAKPARAAPAAAQASRRPAARPGAMRGCRRPRARPTSPPTARCHWPGGRYVDWVGTDFYSTSRTSPTSSASTRSMRRFGKPFVFGEWAVWGADDPGFVQRLFAWSESTRPRADAIYNQGKRTDGPFRLSRYPRAARALRSLLNLRRFRFTA